ncbi:hypothetical protein O3M35_005758 [Rhynocoris fuscipes]|uniref:Tubulin glycylase 3A-like n=1 Tax=Rhynocoris fuscipes TaxID=488301 RepID=A0AAW1DJR6_9HEMI
MLRNTAVNFIWATSENIDWNNLSKNTLVSRFPRVYFTTKVGICSYLQQSHWFFENGIAYTRFPRCYIISCNDDVQAFVRDFRLTACAGMLKRVIRALQLGHASIFFSDKGKIPLRAIEFAVKRCSEFVSSEEHEDIDHDTEQKIWDHQWDQYLTYYYQLVHERETFVSATEDQIKEIYDCCKTTLETLRKFCTQMDMDGTNNLWIVKPGAKSRGRGIVLLTKLEDIVHRVSVFSANEPRYVVQKYIEKPLLIYHTKFDIRQWFLVTSAYPLTIWMYKECYLRFCSQLFSLNNTHESIHLSNNAIQCKYKNAKRDGALPDENMWDCYTFQAYLRTIGKADRWESVIYPGMKQSITGALLAAQEHMEHRRNCFELYGADFMLTEDLVPWLIEINSSPCMSPTTSVTARLCAQCLEDVIKVVIDKRNNKDAETGMFELAYRQQVSPPQPYMGMNLTVRGCHIGRPIKGGRSAKQENVEKKPKESDSPQVKEAIKRLSDQLAQGIDTLSPPSTPITPATSTTSTETSNTSSIEAIRSSSRYKMNKNYEHISRRISSSKTMATVDIPQVNHLFDWNKRVEKTKAACQNMITKFNNDDKTDDEQNINITDGKTNEKLPSVVTEKTHKRTLERKSPILNKLHRISSLPNIKRKTSKEVNNNGPPLFTTYNFVKPINTRVS